MSSETEKKFIKEMTKEILKKKIAGSADVTDMIEYLNDKYKDKTLYDKADKEIIAKLILKILNAHFTVHMRQNVMTEKEYLLVKELENMKKITDDEFLDNIPEELPNELKKEIERSYKNKKESLEEIIEKIKADKNENEVKIQIRAGKLEAAEHFTNFMKILSDVYPDAKVFVYLKNVMKQSKIPSQKELTNIERRVDIKHIDKIKKALDILKIKHFYISKEDIKKKIKEIEKDEKKKEQIIIGLD
jgi:hypothetical protein